MTAEKRLAERVARALHDNAHRGWPHDFEAGCPDGKSDADAWRAKVAPLQAALLAEGLEIVPVAKRHRTKAVA